ncbi:glycoside hydrolase family 6 protein [Streptomyces sp. NPDC001941]|uniref:glycoside hydrolase family 6 protein n=1 Tax=Streptomyces sp. NPDC001941 TaxID=3154659 RepID=UPI003318C05E
MRPPNAPRLRAATTAAALTAALLCPLPSLAAAAPARAAGEAHQDNPFAGATQYVNPLWKANVLREADATPDSALAARMRAVAGQPTAVWMDNIRAIAGAPGGMGLEAHLDAALAQKGSAPLVFNVVVYDLPGRDCNALASNGELPATAAGLDRYKSEYVDPLVSVLAKAKYAGLRIVATVEPDSLPNVVTNSSVPVCQTAGPLYEQGIAYALTRLHALTNVYTYLDSGHAGWLGWPSNSGPTAAEFVKVAGMTPAGVNSVDGFVTDTANTTPLKEPYFTGDTVVGGTKVIGAPAPDNFYEWNPDVDEASFTADLYPKLVAAGFPAGIGMLVDTSRNGWGGPGRPAAASTSTDPGVFVRESRVDRRPHRGAWCNPVGAGLGERPTASPAGYPASHLDAFVWVKPPGESDGASKEIPNDEGKRLDRMCDPTYAPPAAGWNGRTTGALPDAPLSGKWFGAQFRQLVANAYPAVNAGPAPGDTTAPTTPTALRAGTASATSVPLTWTASTDDTGVTAYDVYRDGTRVGTATTPAFTDTGLRPSTTYTWTVRARDAAGNTSHPSAPASATTSADGGSGDVLLTRGRTAWASSVEGDLQPARAVDGDPNSRWGSAFQDNQWINIDLGAAHRVSKVVLRWEAAYARGYKVQLSDDPGFSSWTDLSTVTAGDGGTDTLTVTGQGRYLRVLGQTRATPYGFSLYEIEAYGL